MGPDGPESSHRGPASRSALGRDCTDGPGNVPEHDFCAGPGSGFGRIHTGPAGLTHRSGECVARQFRKAGRKGILASFEKARRLRSNEHPRRVCVPATEYGVRASRCRHSWTQVWLGYSYIGLAPRSDPCQPQADLNGPVHRLHDSRIGMAYAPDEALTVHRTDLVQHGGGALR